MAQRKYTLIEHTADLGIGVKGKELKDLFINAAKAMFGIIALPCKPGRAVYRVIKIKQAADSRQELLVNWLNELLSLSSAKGLVFTVFKINKISTNNLEAVVSGIESSKCRIDKEIKAATYHELKLEKTGKGWQAEIIFDV